MRRVQRGGGDFTVGQVGDSVKEELESLTGRKIRITVKNIQDFRNYKVTCERAQMMLGFAPRYSVRHIIENLYEHLPEYEDFSCPNYYNIEVFRQRVTPSLRNVEVFPNSDSR